MNGIPIKKMRLVLNLAFFFGSGLLHAQQTYFQQRVDYKMNVTLQDDEHTLSAYQEINYVNNSPQTLEYIYFHLWPNAYKDNSSALAKQLLWQGKTDLYFSKPEERGYIDSLDFKVNGKPVKWQLDKENKDICKLLLNTPLRPSDSLLITTPFFLKIPDAKFSRLGHTYQSYYMTQWYPKPAVFDNTGWHQMPYLDQGEFYSEFGSFDVKITVPDNYVLCATGDRVNAQEEEVFLESKKNETLKFISNTEKQFLSETIPVSSKLVKTIRFVQSNVHDFAWFADKRFLVMRDEIELPNSRRKINSWTYFLPENAALWKKAINYVNEATVFYSYLNGDYPYDHVTAIDGSIMAGGGMEYPNITVIGEASTDIELDLVIAHEVGHNWFYGILGSNERDVPFMDEGINSFYELRYMRAKYPKRKLSEFIGRDSSFKLFGLHEIPLWKYHELSFYGPLRAHTDQQMALRSTEYTESNYGGIVYSKSALVFDYLMEYMGETNFNSAMRTYFETYKFKHPAPNDLFKILSTYAGRDLSDFQKHCITSTDRIDYKIKRVKKNEDGSYTLQLKNKTGVELPFNVYGFKNNKPVGVVWFDGFEKSRTITFPNSEVDRFVIDGFEKMPDINRKNNSIKTHGILKHTKPLKLSFLSRYENPSVANINYVPIGGGNFYNGAMLGISIHNYGLYQKRFEYLIAPMYAFNTKTPVGFAEFNFNFYPKAIVNHITFGLKAKTFSYDYFETKFLNTNSGNNFKDVYYNYYKIAPYLQFEIKKRSATSLVSQFITYSNTNLFTDSLDSRKLTTLASSGPVKKNVYSFVNQLQYDLYNKRAIDPFNFHIDFQHTASMAKVSAALQYKITLNKKQHVELRLFAGAFIAGSEEERGYYAFRASGYNGWHDYLFESNFAARNERGGFGFTQFTEKDGALKIWTPLGQSPHWMSSLNLKSPRIFKLPLKVFTDIVVCDGRALLTDKVLWDAGLNLTLWDDIIEIYVPFLYSTDIRKTLDLNGVDFVHSIRFTFNIHKLAPKTIIQNNLF